MNLFRTYSSRFLQGLFATLTVLLVNQPLGASAQTTPTNLTSFSWKLVLWGPEDQLSEPLVGDKDLTAQFSDDDNLVRGTSGCNFWGTYFQTDDSNNLQLDPQQLDSTTVGCSSEILEQEKHYYNALVGAQRYEIDDKGLLKIFYQTNTETGVLIFAPQ